LKAPAGLMACLLISRWPYTLLMECPELPDNKSGFSQRPPPLPEGANDRLSRLLPVIRGFRDRRSFQPESSVRGIALYRDCAIFFKPSKGEPLPEEVFRDDGGAALLAASQIRQKTTVRYDEIAQVAVTREYSSASIKFSGVCQSPMEIPLSDCGHVVEVLGQFLGNRVQSKLSPEDLKRNKLPAQNSVMIAVAILAGGLLYFILTWISMARASAHKPDDFSSMISLWSMAGLMAAGVSGFYLLDRALAHPSRRKAGEEPFRSRSLAILLRLVGIPLFVLGSWRSESIYQWLTQTFQVTNEGSQQMLRMLAPFLGMWPGGILIYLAYRLGLGSGRSRIEKDQRSSILYLRAFEDDGKHSLNPNTFTAKALGIRPFALLERFGGPMGMMYPLRILKLMLGIAVDTSEEQLGGYFRKFGPFVAIGKPGELLAMGGADRVYERNESWKETALNLMDRSRVVILQPAETEGVWWEISTCLARIEPARLLICLANYQGSQQGYDEFRLRFEDLLGRKLPRTQGNALFMRFDDDWTPHLLPTAFQLPVLWPIVGTAVNLRKTLWPFLQRLEVPCGKAAPVAVPGFGFKFAAVAAVMLWCVLPLATPFVRSAYRGLGVVFESVVAEPTREFTGKSPSYTWRLNQGWSTNYTQNGLGAETLFLAPNNLMGAAVVASSEVGSAADLDEMEQDTLRRIDLISNVPPRVVNRMRSERFGQQCLDLEIEALLKTEQQLLEESRNESRLGMDFLLGKQAALKKPEVKHQGGERIVYFVRLYSGPKGRFRTLVWTSGFAIEWLPKSRSTVTHVMDSFHLQ
jgi:hypothetical protein